MNNFLYHKKSELNENKILPKLNKAIITITLILYPAKKPFVTILFPSLMKHPRKALTIPHVYNWKFRIHRPVVPFFNIHSK